jgi:serine protease AprX
LTKTTPVTITIYNASGQVVSTLVDGVQAAGEHSVMFDGTETPSGVYFCQLKTPDAQLQTKLTVLR